MIKSAQGGATLKETRCRHSGIDVKRKNEPSSIDFRANRPGRFARKSRDKVSILLPVQQAKACDRSDTLLLLIRSPDGAGAASNCLIPRIIRKLMASTDVRRSGSDPQDDRICRRAICCRATTVSIKHVVSRPVTMDVRPRT